MIKNKEFVVEKIDNTLIMRNKDDPSGNALFSINKNMISYEKGKTPFELVETIVFRRLPNDKFAFDVYTTKDTKWNETMKKRHPLIWKIGVIRNFFSRVFYLGVTDLKNKKNLFEFISKIGIKIELK